MGLNGDAPRGSLNGEALSPALRAPSGPPAYELKFLLPAPLAAQVEAWAAEHLAYDPHADSARDNAYRIHTLYLDTPEWDVFRRSPRYGRRKFRLRRYGTERGLFLERKTKAGERVSKRRTCVPDTELSRLTGGADDPTWPGEWFRHRLLARWLRPACLVTYDRVAFVGSGAEGQLRLTLDRHIDCTPADDWVIAEAVGGRRLFADEVVLELKYQTALPTLFKRLLGEFRLSPRPASKYRLAVEAWALAGQSFGKPLQAEQAKEAG
jgi:hypothetical protein